MRDQETRAAIAQQLQEQHARLVEAEAAAAARTEDDKNDEDKGVGEALPNPVPPTTAAGNEAVSS